jgi:radical SAM protein with 4Fe4S-binding SPASM domain
VSDESFVVQNIGSIFLFLEEMQCKHLVLDFNCSITNDLLLFLFSEMNQYNLHEILFLANYCDYLYSEDFSKTVYLTDRYKSFFIFHAPFNKNLEDLFFYSTKSKKISYDKSESGFNINKTLYEEARNCHTYFNRKMYIGPNGEIKNAPETDQVFGRIQDLKSGSQFKEIISSPDFQKYWFVHKEIIDVCKDCEFRYMCVDNRVPVERNNLEWYHITECNYNPYIAKWSHEKGYHSLLECGVISNETDFSIDHTRIAAINAQLSREEERETE